MGAAGESVNGSFLDVRVDAEIQVLARLRRHAFQHPLRALVGIHFHQFVTGRAVQLALVIALQARLADVRGAGVAVRIEMRQIAIVYACHVADHVREVGAEGIVAGEIGHHVHAREFPGVHRKVIHLVFVQVEFQRHALERAMLFQRTLEILDVVVGQRHHRREPLQHGIHVLDLFRRHFQPECRHVVGQQHAVAVVDQAAWRRQVPQVHAVGLGAGGELVVPQHLQVEKPPAQHAQRHHDQREAGQRATAEVRGFAPAVLEGAPGLHARPLMLPSRAAGRARRRSAGTRTARRSFR